VLSFSLVHFARCRWVPPLPTVLPGMPKLMTICAVVALTRAAFRFFLPCLLPSYMRPVFLYLAGPLLPWPSVGVARELLSMENAQVSFSIFFFSVPPKHRWKSFEGPRCFSIWLCVLYVDPSLEASCGEASLSSLPGFSFVPSLLANAHNPISSVLWSIAVQRVSI